MAINTGSVKIDIYQCTGMGSVRMSKRKKK